MEDDYIYNRARERTGALVFLALGIFAFWAIGGKSIDTQLFPRLVSSAIIIGAIATFVRSFLNPAGMPAASASIEPPGTAVIQDKTATGDRPEQTLIALAFGLTVIYVLGIQYVGYSISTLLFIPLSAFIFGYRNWIAILIGSVGFVLLTTVLFRFVFHILLPEPLLRF